MSSVSWRIVIYRTVRMLAVTLALFLAVSSLADVLGALPHSGATRPLAERASKAFWLFVVSAALAVPYRHLKWESVRALVAVGVGVSLIWGFRIAVPGIVDYFRGLKSWHVVPASSLLLILLIANAHVFRHVRSTARTAG